MRVLVCGGRDYKDYEVLKDTLGSLDISYIISGGAKGADALGEQYALEHNIPYVIFMAQWDTYGKKAGYIRNAEMLEKGKPDMVVAFPGGNGTKMMKRLAYESGVPVMEITDGTN